MREWASLIGRALAGWVACGATVALGRQVMSLERTLVVHAVVAPLVFGLLTRSHFRHYPQSSPAVTSGAMLGLVVALDALVVAPFLEHSYAMFASLLGTWVPFASILVASYDVGRVSRHPTGEP